MYIHIYRIYPPTLAFAKAGVAPGTTGGVEPALSLLLQDCSLPFACTSLAAASTKLLAVSVPALQPALCLHIALSCYGIRACRLPGFKPLKPLTPSNSFAAASTTPGRQPLLLQGCSLPFPGRQRSSIEACPLPAHSPLLLGHSSLPFARLQTPKTPKTLQFLSGSFHQAWPSAFAAPGLQPALCLHIPRGSFHQAPDRQRSSIAACPLPAHSPLLLRHSSLPFARLQTPKTPKTLQFLSGSFHQAWPSAFAAPGLQPALSWPSAFQHCSLPFACTAFSC